MLRFFWDNALRARWPVLILIIAGGLLVSLLQVANIGMIVPIVGLLVGEPHNLETIKLPFVTPLLGSMASWPKQQAVLGLLLVATALLILKVLLQVARQYVTWRLFTSIRYSLTRQYFSRYLGTTYPRQVAQASGTNLHQIWDPPYHVAEMVRTGAELLSSGLQILALLALMTWISWKLTIVTMLLAAGGIFAFDRLFRRPLQRVSEQTYTATDGTMSFLADIMAGVRQIKAHSAELPMIRQFDRILERMDRADERLGRLRYWPSTLNELFFFGFLVFLAATSTSPLGLDIAYVATFMLAVVRLSPGINSMVEAQVSLYSSSRNVAMARILLEEWKSEDNAGCRSVPSQVERLIFDRVSFAYPTRPEYSVLADVSLEFHKGEITAIVGSSGAGKSTVADLIIRLFSPLQGKIELDGIDIREFELGAWRRQVGFVSQDPFLFNASIRDNIALADPSASLDAIIGAARLAHIDDFIETLPEGYDTVVGDRGLRLSGGQRQRVAIARALLTGAHILVFDEATSALDNISERVLQETIGELCPGRIVIVIAHRLSTILSADRIVVLSEGRVVEEGSHSELLNRGEVYAQLYAADH